MGGWAVSIVRSSCCGEGRETAEAELQVPEDRWRLWRFQAPPPFLPGPINRNDMHYDPMLCVYNVICICDVLHTLQV